ncbi:MAG: hypothetical protein ACI9V1_001057 [Spirosomataceae bacterium]|jgi:hypothetical protein
MKNNFYLLLMFIVVGFTSCQKEPYATFQKAQSETFARTIKAKPVTVEAVQTPEVVNQVPASNITASSSDDISFEEPASVDLLSQIEVTPVEVVTVPVTTISRVSAPATTITHVSGKNKLLNKILAKKINKLNKKAERASSSTVRSGTKSLLIVGLTVIAIGLLLTLIPVLNVLSGIVIATGAIIAIIGLLQQLQVI